MLVYFVVFCATTIMFGEIKLCIKHQQYMTR